LTVTGTTQLNDHLGVGDGPVTSQAIINAYANGTIVPGGGIAIGIWCQPAFSATTTNGRSLNLGVATVASAFTMGEGTVICINPPGLGAGSTVTDMSGISIANQGSASVTNAHGLFIYQQEGATGRNYGIYNAGAMLEQSYIDFGMMDIAPYP